MTGTRKKLNKNGIQVVFGNLEIFIGKDFPADTIVLSKMIGGYNGKGFIIKKSELLQSGAYPLSDLNEIKNMAIRAAEQKYKTEIVSGTYLIHPAYVVDNTNPSKSTTLKTRYSR